MSDTQAVVPLVAAFTDDTSTLSEVRVARLVRFHRDRGAKGFLVNGETGEAFQLAHSERKQLLEWVIRDADGLPVYVNVTAMTTAGAVDLCQHASRHGAKSAVVCPPPMGSYTEIEAKALQAAITRHGNLQCVFADPRGAWGTYALTMPALEAVEEDWAVLQHPAPDEGKIGGKTVTPFAMFGCDKLEAIGAKLEVFKPAMQSVVRHGGLNRATRVALTELGCDVGVSRSPVFELGEDGKKILLGMLKLLGA